MNEIKITPRFNCGETPIESEILKFNGDENLKSLTKQSEPYIQTSKTTKTVKNKPFFLLLCKKFHLRNDFDKDHCDEFLASKLQTFEDFPFDNKDVS